MCKSVKDVLKRGTLFKLCVQEMSLFLEVNKVIWFVIKAKVN